MDTNLGIITDRHATLISISDSVRCLDRLDRQKSRFGLRVRAVGLDAGHDAARIAKGLQDRKTLGSHGPPAPPSPRLGMPPKEAFVHEAGSDGYRCPEGQLLDYQATTRNWYRAYRNDPELCRDCPLRASCIGSATGFRTITRHVWEHARKRDTKHCKKDWGKAVYKRDKEGIERSFADANQLHGHVHARFRRLNAVKIQCLLASATQSIKKIALVFAPSRAGGTTP